MDTCIIGIKVVKANSKTFIGESMTEAVRGKKRDVSIKERRVIIGIVSVRLRMLMISTTRDRRRREKVIVDSRRILIQEVGVLQGILVCTGIQRDSAFQSIPAGVPFLS